MSFVITGSVAYDYLMRYPGRFRDHILPDQLDNISLSFLADSMRRVRGGVAVNIAYSMKLLGAQPVIFSTVGEDFGDYRRWLETMGLDTTHMIEIADEFTASFFCNTDAEGKQISSFYSGAMQYASQFTLADHGFAEATLVLIGAGDPVAMLNQAAECQTLGIPYALDPSFQVARFSREEMKEKFHGATYLFCNEYELAVIQNKTDWSLDEVKAQVATLVVTLAEKGSLIYTNYGQGEIVRVPPAQPHSIQNPTGAGDAFRGGFFAAQQQGLPLEICGRVGSLCAAYALEHLGPIDHSFTLDEFVDRYAANFGPEPALAALKVSASAVFKQSKL
jgi:adenosine kinase